jgi:hypothetical protein
MVFPRRCRAAGAQVGPNPFGMVRVWNVVSPIAPIRKVEDHSQGCTGGRMGKGCRSKRRPVCNGSDRGSNFALPRQGADFRRVLNHEKGTESLNLCGYLDDERHMASLKAHRTRR